MNWYLNFIYSFLLIQTLAVAIIDVKTRKISNQWLFINLGLFFISLWFAPEYYSLTFEHLLPAFAFFGVGFVLYLANVMGAGDSKYLFSLFLLIPGLWTYQAFTGLVICTFAIGLFSLFTSVVNNGEKILVYAKTGHIAGIKDCLGGKFPFAPVIFFSWVFLGFHLYIMSS